jgi:hypothetical protein
MRVECNLWMMVSAKFSSRAWLQALTKGPFENFVDYVLGKHVWDLGQTHNTDGAVTTAGIPSPSWELVLAYEFAMRKAAFRSVREDGCTLTDAMAAVITDIPVALVWLIVLVLDFKLHLYFNNLCLISTTIFKLRQIRTM